jgi:hypothetical protein
MNFRSLDPRAAGEGMSGATKTDREVWGEFFDPTSSTLRVDSLNDEFTRPWGAAVQEQAILQTRMPSLPSSEMKPSRPTSATRW